MSFMHVGNIAQQYGHAIAGGDHNIADVVQVMQQANAAHVHALAAKGQVISAGVCVARTYGSYYLWQSHVHRQQPAWIDLRLVLLRGSTEGGNVDHARHLLEFATN